MHSSQLSQTTPSKSNRKSPPSDEAEADVDAETPPRASMGENPPPNALAVWEDVIAAPERKESLRSLLDPVHANEPRLNIDQGLRLCLSGAVGSGCRMQDADAG